MAFTIPGWLLVLGFFLPLAGCGEDKPPAMTKPKAAAPVDMVAKEEAEQKEVATPGYLYTPVGKRDPFRSAFKEAKPTESTEPGGILTKFEIDQLKLIAIISGAKPVAQVELPGGKGVLVKIGTRVGKNMGRVVRITNDEVIVAEDYTDWRHLKVTNYIHIRLGTEKGKEKGLEE
jgi:type IV pilus assembly protein PilP